MSIYDDVVAGIAETSEFGGRALLAESYYPVSVTVADVGNAKEKDDGTGGNPFVMLACEVLDGPFAGQEFQSRVPLTAGKDGGYLGYINNMTKCITGKSVDASVLGEMAFTFEPGAPAEDNQMAFRNQFLELDSETKKDFMVKYARLAMFDGKTVIVKYSHEKRTFQDETTGEDITKIFGKINGFYSMNDPKKGLAFVKKVCFPRQIEVKAKMEAAS